MIDKETWKTGTDRDKMKKIIKYHLQVQYKKRLLEKEKTFSSNRQTIRSFFLRMIAFKTHLDLVGKLKWIGKMT